MLRAFVHSSRNRGSKPRGGHLISMASMPLVSCLISVAAHPEQLRTGNILRDDPYAEPAQRAGILQVKGGGYTAGRVEARENHSPAERGSFYVGTSAPSEYGFLAEGGGYTIGTASSQDSVFLAEDDRSDTGATKLGEDGLCAEQEQPQTICQVDTLTRSFTKRPHRAFAQGLDEQSGGKVHKTVTVGLSFSNDIKSSRNTVSDGRWFARRAIQQHAIACVQE